MPLLPEITALIHAAGFDPSAFGEAAVSSAVKRRMALLSCSDEKAYALALRGSEAEFEELVLLLAVPETWFFREPESFAFLKIFAAARGAGGEGAPLRVLSLPCCTGEEPYSIAIALLEAGLAPADFEIDAVDIHPSFLTAARAARYDANSFRGMDEELRRKYFLTESGKFILREEVARAVRFEKGNAMDFAALAKRRPYDAIFCRNLTIYMHAAARVKLAEALDRCLKPGGVFFSGHAETMPLPNYRPVKHSLAFAYQRAVLAPAAPVPGPLPAGETFRTISAAPLSGGSVPARPRKAPLPAVPAREGAPCWQLIGSEGDKSCDKLAELAHCRNCGEFAVAARRFFDRTPPAGYRRECAEALAQKKEAEHGKESAVIVFRLGREWLALPTGRLIRVLEPQAIHRIPHRGGALLGLAAVDGELHLCVDAARIMQSPAGRETSVEPAPAVCEQKLRCMILAGSAEDQWLFSADEVGGILSVTPEQTREEQESSGGMPAKGVFAWKDRQVTLLDEELFFSAFARSVK